MSIQTFLLSLKKWFLLGFLVVLCIIFFYFDLPTYLKFETLKKYQSFAEQWTHTHYFSAVTIYILVFVISIACAIPTATILTLVGGFLFGSIAIVYALAATTLGGSILFFAVRTSIGSIIARRSSGWIKIMEAGFQRNAFQYLFMLRLIPVMPCWVSNVSAGALNVPATTFFAATILGLFPTTVIYAMVGRGLDKFFTANQPPSYTILFTPSIFFPLLALVLLSLFPLIYKSVKKRQQKQ